MDVSENHRFCVAPMMGYTNRHFRYLLRLMSRRAKLYTEMIVCDAVLRENPKRILAFHPLEHPLGIQLGGSNPVKMAWAAKLAQDWGYDEININAGCPSARVHTGAFGACLMKEPERLAECVAAMQARVTIPITVKCRIGVDQHDAYDHFQSFVQIVATAGCQTFIVHARKAWLKGLSPKENRRIPKLNYDYVYQIKRDFPNLRIILNGGLSSPEEARAQVRTLDGIMLGRAVSCDPLMMLEVDSLFYGEPPNPATVQQVLAAYLAYAAKQSRAVPLRLLLRYLPNPYRAKPGAANWRRFWNDAMNAQTQSLQSVIEHATACFPSLFNSGDDTAAA